MDKPLNIIVLFNDDHGQWALPTYGNSELHTPNIDYLADSGVVFDNAFTPVPVCSPARACFFTGLMPSQHGIHDYIAAADQFHQKAWLDDFITLPQILSENGYQTGLSGKWHLGRDEKVQSGFDDWFALSGDYPIKHKGSYRYSDNGQIKSLSGYKTNLIADRTVEFIRRQSPDQPFFHFTSFYATHSPWSGHPERLVRMYRGCSFDDIPSEERLFAGKLLNIERTSSTTEEIQEARAQYYASVTTIDEAVGRILDELETSGFSGNTIIVYTSDHGLCLGHHGVWGKGNATAPQNMIEESIRIPMILRAPAILPKATRRSEFVDHLDLYQTILDCADLAPPGNNYAGKSLLSLIAEQADWREVQYGEYGTARMIRTHSHKLIQRYDNQTSELFNLSSIAGEEQNVIAMEESKSIAAELGEMLAAHFNHLGCAQPNNASFSGENRFNTAEAWRNT